MASTTPTAGRWEGDAIGGSPATVGFDVVHKARGLLDFSSRSFNVLEWEGSWGRLSLTFVDLLSAGTGSVTSGTLGGVVSARFSRFSPRAQPGDKSASSFKGSCSKDHLLPRRPLHHRSPEPHRFLLPSTKTQGWVLRLS